MNKNRISRISEEVRKVVSDILFNGLKDPRVSSMATVNKVEVSRDLSFAKIYVSVLGDEKEKEDTISGLDSAKGFIRKEIGNRLDLRHTPLPIFILDESIEEAIRLSKLISEVNKEIQDDNKDVDDVEV